MATVKHVNEDGSVEIYSGVVIFKENDYFRFGYRIDGRNVEFDGWLDYWELVED